MDWSTYDSVSVVPEVNWASTTDPFYPGGPTDSFALRLVGALEIPETGQWTIGLSSDAGARLFIGGELVIDHDASHSFARRDASIHLGAGSHDIEIRYIETNYAQGLALDWSGPGTRGRNPIPASAFNHNPESVAAIQAEGHGLRAYWIQDVSHATTLGEVDWTQYDSTTIARNVSWPITNNPFYTDGPTDSFALRLVGTITVPSSGAWRFKLGSDAGARLLINGQLVINDDANHSFRFTSGTIALNEGAHTFEVRYLERNYSQGLVATWQAPGAAYEEVIPSTAFTPAPVVPPGDTGDGLTAYWSDSVSHATVLGEVDWTTYDRQTAVSKVSWRITNAPFQSDGPTDSFALRLVGRIEIPSSGSWTFKLGSDAGARLLINNQVVVNDDANHSFRFQSGSITLSAGTHDIEVLYLERTYSQGLVLTWQAPGAAHEEVVPASAFSPAAFDVEPGGMGLRAYWSSNVSHATRLGQVDWASYDHATNESQISWGITNEPFYTDGPTDSFAVRLVGLLRVPASGSWTFKLGSDAGAQLFINGALVINDDANHSFRFRSGSLTLPEGDARIEVRYLERTYSQGLVLTWNGPTLPYESVIPASAFNPDPDEPPVDAGGGGLRAYWTANTSHATLLGESDWMTYDTTGTVSKAYWRITNNALYEGGPTDYFTARLVGHIDIPSDGTWTFGLGSDAGARLYINGDAIINDDANHSFRFASATAELTAGTHDIEIRYIERSYSQGLVATWQGPGTHEEVIPSSALTAAALASPGGPSAGVGGLTATWIQGRSNSLDTVNWERRPVVTQVDNINWRISNNAFYPGGPTDYFAVKLTGRITIPATGDWTFKIGSDAGARLLINDETLINDDANHSFRFTSATRYLEAGVHTFEAQYLELNHSQGFVATWQGPTVELEEVIPASAFVSPSRDRMRVVQWREVGAEDLDQD